jgi:hypothetical protein
MYIILQAKRSVKEESFMSEGELFGLDTSTEYEDDDDSDWVQTPLYKTKIIYNYHFSIKLKKIKISFCLTIPSS